MSDTPEPTGSGSTAPNNPDGSTAPQKPRRSPNRAGAATKTAREPEIQVEGGASPSADGNSEAPSGEAKPRRRGSRGGRGRSSAARANAQRAASNDACETDVEVEGPTDLTPAKSLPVEKPKIGDSKPSEDPASSAEDDATDDESPAKKRRRRGGRRRGSKRPVAESAIDIDTDEIELDEETLEKRRGKERKGRPVGRYLMCVQRRNDATQIAVLEGRNLIEHYVSRPNDDVAQIDGNIYLSRVQNVLPGMEAAFIDIGTPKNAVLYRGDVRYDADDIEGAVKKDDARIEQMIKSGQVITTQVTKNPIGAKGARLTQEVSLPGRFVVLMPNNSTYGISKRLPDDERKRLRKVLDEVKPAQHGIIVRTAAEGVTAAELQRDVKRLLKQWEQIEAKAHGAQAPKLLYREPDMAVRIIREEFNKNYRGVIIDDPELFEEVRDYVASISPELADRIELFDRNAEPLPLFERYHVHEQLHKALDRKVWLPSGGSLIIERTEALTVIDVNTGKNVGTSNLEETVYRNNLEAAEEIAHQLRLRDIGGIIVIDFIDMEIKRNRDEVLNKLRDALARDKTRTQAYPIGELGLVEMTRKRISEGLVESFSESCPTCTGRGFVIDEALMSSN